VNPPSSNRQEPPPSSREIFPAILESYESGKDYTPRRGRAKSEDMLARGWMDHCPRPWALALPHASAGSSPLPLGSPLATTTATAT
jgi:hypothetical protein